MWPPCLRRGPTKRSPKEMKTFQHLRLKMVKLGAKRQMRRARTPTLASNTVTSIPKLCSWRAAARPDTPPPITITFPVFLAVTKHVNNPTACHAVPYLFSHIAARGVYRDDLIFEKIIQMCFSLKPSIPFSLCQRLTHWVEAWPSCKCQSWSARAFQGSCVSCAPARRRLSGIQRTWNRNWRRSINVIFFLTVISSVLLLYGASSCWAVVSKVSWIFGLSSHSWSW